MRAQRLVVDAAVAAAVFGLTAAVLAFNGLGVPDPRTRGLDLLGVGLALLSALPLLVRRRAPWAAYLLTAAAAALLGITGYPYDVPFGPLVAAYTLAVVATGERAGRRRVAFTAVALFVPVITVALLAGGRSPREALGGLVFWALLMVGVWIAGDRTRLRHEQLHELRERAERGERDAERERRLAAARERTRIARELHDSAGHAVNTILVQAGAARLLRSRDPEGAGRAMDAVESLARRLIGDIDQIVRALREDGVAAGDTPADPARLDELITQHRESGMLVAADISGDPRDLPPSLAWAGYRILQEALTNAARHGAGTADVAVRYGAGEVRIEVRNPIDAVPALPRPDGRNGIVGMTERVHLLGGVLESAADGGTWRLHARLPRPPARP